MAIYRAPRPKNHYTQIRNDVLRDDRLSYRARGILAVILSQADEWQTTAEAMARQGREGRDAVRAAFGELEEVGYIVRLKRQDDRGRWTTQVVVYDTPEAARQAEVDAQGTLFDSPTPGNPSSVPTPGKPTPGKPTPENQALIEHHQEHSGPTDQSLVPLKPDADLVATAVYEAMDKMGNYMAVRMVAGKALKAGHTVEAVTASMVALVDAGRPITGQTVYTSLNGAKGATIRNTNHDHWQNGGGYSAPQEGPTP